jgi:chromate transporter
MVITMAFISYLMAGLVTFLPCYVLAVVPAPYLPTPGHQAFVEGITAAAIKALSEAVVVLVTRSLVDIIVRFGVVQ